MVEQSKRQLALILVMALLSGCVSVSTVDSQDLAGEEDVSANNQEQIERLTNRTSMF